MKHPLTSLKIRLGADYVCWIGATAALGYYGYPTVGALVGATGIVYLRAATKKYLAMRAQFKMMQAAMNAFLHHLQTGEEPPEMDGIIIRKFGSAEEANDWLEQHNKDDDQPNP